MMLFPLFLFIGSVFGVLGAGTAYLITYNEYVHHYPTKREPRRMALRAGLTAFIFFIALSVLLSFFFSKLAL